MTTLVIAHAAGSSELQLVKHFGGKQGLLCSTKDGTPLCSGPTRRWRTPANYSPAELPVMLSLVVKAILVDHKDSWAQSGESQSGPIHLTRMQKTVLERRRIGALEVSLTGVGCNNFGWRIDAAQSQRVVEAALDAGINFFDTADIYDKGHSEEYLGRALAGRRREAVIATKFGMKFDEERNGARKEYVLQAAEDSLRRLGTDYIDLYQLHQPDSQTPIAETLEALDQLVRQGKVREIGCSNFSAAQIREAHQAAGSRAHFVSVQNQYSLFHREPESEVLPECQRFGLAFLPYFPLANGLLTGKYRPGQPPPKGSRGDAGWGPKVFTEENMEKVSRLIEFAATRGHSVLELAFSWLAAQPAVASVIAGATSPEQVQANAAAPSWKLSAKELREIDGLL